MDISSVLILKYGDKKWSLSGNSYSGLHWADESAKPTYEELIAIWESEDFRQEISDEEVVNSRRRKIMATWPLHKQFEALTEASMGREEKLEELKNFIISVKEEFPKD